MESRIDVVVFGQLARDLVLVVDTMPAAGGSGYVRERREMLGGKGANQAVALAQLGMSPALVAVVGDDETGARLLAQASATASTSRRSHVGPVPTRPCWWTSSTGTAGGATWRTCLGT